MISNTDYFQALVEFTFERKFQWILKVVLKKIVALC